MDGSHGEDLLMTSISTRSVTWRSEVRWHYVGHLLTYLGSRTCSWGLKDWLQAAVQPLRRMSDVVKHQSPYSRRFGPAKLWSYKSAGIWSVGNFEKITLQSTLRSGTKIEIGSGTLRQVLRAGWFLVVSSRTQGTPRLPYQDSTLTTTWRLGTVATLSGEAMLEIGPTYLLLRRFHTWSVVWGRNLS